MRFAVLLFGLLVFSFGQANALPVIWDNGIEFNGVGGKASSPPAFPNIVVADDIFVGADGWEVGGFRALTTDYSTFNPGGSLEIIIYGVDLVELFRVSTTNFSRDAVGEQYFGRDAFIYSTTDLGFNLTAGTYWIGFRLPDATGEGTSYWMSSDGGPDGQGTATSLSGLSGDLNQSNGYQFAFEVLGAQRSADIPVPTPLALLGLGLIGMGALRRRASKA